MAKKKFLGLQYPLVRTSRGIMAQKSGVDQIKADLLQLLLTNPGERVMMPNYGTPLRKLFFEPNDPALEITARQMISDAILMWEPRIVVTNIQVSANFNSEDLHPLDPKDDLEHILGVKITFVDPENIQQIEELVLEVPIGD